MSLFAITGFPGFILDPAAVSKINQDMRIIKRGKKAKKRYKIIAYLTFQGLTLDTTALLGKAHI